MRLSAAILPVVLAGAALAAEPDAPAPSTVEYATQKRLNLRFPQPVDREALVVLEFDVLANGRTANITLLDDGFHEERFVKEAMRALEQSRWDPRRVNGEPVDSQGLRKRFSFSVANQQQGITEEFALEAEKLEDLLNKKDFAGAEAHAQWMLVNTVTLKYEYAILEAELAQTYALMGRPQDALQKIRKATSRSTGWPEFLQLLDKPPPNDPSLYLLEKDLVVRLLRLQMQLLASVGLPLEAMQTYYELAGLEQLAPDDPVVATSLLLTEQIRGGGLLRGEIELGTGGSWRQFLSRRRFALENVRGSIGDMRLACEGGSRDLSYSPGEEWEAPSGWGLCTVGIQGAPGGGFEFVEFAD